MPREQQKASILAHLGRPKPRDFFVTEISVT